MKRKKKPKVKPVDADNKKQLLVCPWYTQRLQLFNNHIWYPSNTIPNEYALKFDSGLVNFESYKSSDKFYADLFLRNSIGQLDLNNYAKEELILNNKYVAQEKKLRKDYDKNHDVKIKKKIDNIPKNRQKRMKTLCKYARSYKTKLYFSGSQTTILHKWLKGAKLMYNYCVKVFRDKPYVFYGFFKAKGIVMNQFKALYPQCETPYDILSYEIKDFCSNVKSSFTNIKRGNITHFMVGKKNTKKHQTITIYKNCVSKNGIYPSLLGKQNKFSESINIDDVMCDCKLTYDKITNNFYLYCPQYIQGKQSSEIVKKQVVALDPGEKTFMAYYSLDDCGMIGTDIRKPILLIEQKIRGYQRVLKKKKNKNGKRINKKKIIIRINKLYTKIKGIVNELHKKTALFLCRNYETILIPKFETKNMLKNEYVVVKNMVSANVNKIKDANKDNLRELRTNLKVYKRKRRLSGRVKFVLNMLSHYKFRQHLISKAEEYGCRVMVVTEEYTSQLCTSCGKLDKTYVNREKRCKHCNNKINRDINGSRNILLKNIQELI